MENLNNWLNEGGPKKNSNFLNQRLELGKEYIGIYKAVRPTTNQYGKTLHYLLDNKDGEVTFDSKNPKIAEIFGCIPFQSRVSVRKVYKDAKVQYEVRLLNTMEDEMMNI